jgi:hypothetical protein
MITALPGLRVEPEECKPYRLTGGKLRNQKFDHLRAQIRVVRFSMMQILPAIDSQMYEGRVPHSNDSKAEEHRDAVRDGFRA